MNKRDFFNSIASEWDARIPNEEKLRKALSLIDAHEGEIVGDIGCGTGILIPHLRKAVGPAGMVLCVDFAHLMLTAARQKFGNFEASYLAGDGERLAIRNECADALICLAVFPHFEDRKSAVAEFARVLKPEGRLTILHLLGSDELKTVHARAGAPIACDFLPPHRELASMLADAGFINLIIRDEPGLFFARAIKK